MKLETRKIQESSIWIWYINTDAQVYRVPKNVVNKCYHYKTRKAIPESEKRYNKPYIKRGRLVIKINNKEFSVGQLMIKSFSKKYRNSRNFCVGYKDGNKLNCKADNLVVYSYKLHGKNTGYLSKSKPVMIRKKHTKNNQKFRSVREAAKHLNVSYQTLLDYIDVKTRPKNSVLKKYEIKYI